MAAPTFVAAGTYLTEGNGASAAVAVPAGVASGDVVLVILYLEATATITPPTGFTQFGRQSTTGTQDHDSVVFWKRLTGADSGTYSFTWTGSVWRTGFAAAYRGCVSSGTPIDVYNGATSGSTAVTASPAVAVTTTGADRLLVWFGATWDVTSWPTPTGFTSGAPAGAPATRLTTTAYKSQAVAGSSGTVQVTTTQSFTKTAHLAALLPVPSGTTYDKTGGAAGVGAGSGAKSVAVSATFGKTTDGTTTTTSNADKLTVSQAAPVSVGTVLGGRARFSILATSANTVGTKFVIYSDSAGAPGTLLAESDILTLDPAVSGDTTEAERVFTFSGANQISVSSGTQYWIGVAWQKPNVASGFVISRDGTTNGRCEGTITWPTIPSTFTATTFTGVIDAYVTYAVSGTTYSKSGGAAAVGAGSGAKSLVHSFPKTGGAAAVGAGSGAKSVSSATTYSKTGGAAAVGAGSGPRSTVHAKTGGGAGFGAGSGAKVVSKTNPKTGGAAAIGAGTGHRTPASALPASAYTLTRWHITLPSDTNSDGVADEVDQPALATYFDPAYFILDSTGRMVFTAPVVGATTSGASGATRSELREHESDYSNSAWDPNTTGRRQFTVTLRADATSITGGTTPRQEMIICQIHGASGTPPLYLAAEWTSAGSPVTPRIRLYLSGTGMTNTNVVTADATTTDITIRLRVLGAQVYLWVVAGQVADLPTTPTGQWNASDFTDQTAWYFKHGAYNKTTIDSASSGQAITKTSFLELLQPGDVNTYAKTGGAAGIGAGSGAKAVSSATVYAKTGGAAATGAGSGARVVVHDKTGGGAAVGAGSGARSIDHRKTGGAAAAGAGSGARSTTSQKTGGAVAVGACSGAKTVASITIYAKTGGAAAIGAGSGARAYVRSKTGGATAAGAGSGPKVVNHAAVASKTGGAAAIGAGSGAKVLDSATGILKTGGAAAIGAGSGARDIQHPVTYDKTGGAAAIGAGSGARSTVHTKTGGAAAAGAGSGAAEVAPATVHAKTGGAVATGAGSGVLDVLAGTVHAKTGGAAARGAGSGARTVSSATVYAKTGGAAATGAGIALIQVIHPAAYPKTGGAVAVGAGSGRMRIGGQFHAGRPYLVGTLRAGEPVAVGRQHAGEPYAVGQLHAGQEVIT